MARLRTLFTIGSKRSGTSLLVRLLNLEEKVFISHESDIAWILYQCRNGLPDGFRCFPWDGPLGMKATLDSAKQIWDLPKDHAPSREDLIAAFFDIQQHLMRHGSAVQPKMDKQEILWIGDKKPSQQCDPEVRSFIAWLFPDARYFHMVRHPGTVLASMQAAARSWNTVPEYWKSGTRTILDRWLAHEEQALIAKKELGSAVLTVRYEDLLLAPVEQMQKCFGHLQIAMAEDLRSNIANMVVNNNLNKKISISDEFHDPKLEYMMDLYGYDFDGIVRDLN